MPAHSHGTVQSVLGPVAAGDLGRTLIHEHLSFGPEHDAPFGRGSVPTRAELPAWEQFVETLAAELREARAHAGLGCLVDLTPTACSRDPLLLRAVSERSGVHVIAATGFWERPSYPDWATTASIDELCAFMTAELQEGIDGTGLRAGVIKVDTAQDAITAAEARVFRAAARVQRALGVAIITHTGLGSMAWEQLAIFEQERADLDRVVIGHLDSQTDAPYCEYVLQHGANVAFDRVGRGRAARQPEIAEKADLVAHLVRNGWGERLLLSHDAGRWFMQTAGFPPEQPPYTHAFTSFAALLRERGVREEQIETIIVANPARALAR